MAYPERGASHQYKPKWLDAVKREEHPSKGEYTAGAATGEGRLEKIKAMERASGGAVPADALYDKEQLGKLSRQSDDTSGGGAYTHTGKK